VSTTASKTSTISQVGPSGVVALSLYNELENIVAIRYSQGRDRTEGAYQVRQWCREQKLRIYAQLRQAGLPRSRREWEQEIPYDGEGVPEVDEYEDWRNTQEDALY